MRRTGQETGVDATTPAIFVFVEAGGTIEAGIASAAGLRKGQKPIAVGTAKRSFFQPVMQAPGDAMKGGRLVRPTPISFPRTSRKS